jgi:NADH-quinone oxidoreductase subunit H
MDDAVLVTTIGATPWYENFWVHLAIGAVVAIAFFFFFIVMYIWTERRVIGLFQGRLGPNRVGPLGLIQSVADVIKVMFKEDIVPDKSDKLLFWLAPFMAFVPVMMILAVVPFSENFQIVNLNVGILYVLAVSAISSIGVFMSGYAGNNKYGLIGGMRGLAQFISYEIPLILSLASLVLISNTFSVNGLVQAQTLPNILMMPLAFVVYFVASLAEISRTPFDIVECDSEIVAGFNIEYSSMKFAMLYLVEYGEAVVTSVLVATLFLGGWHGFFIDGPIPLIIKMVLVFLFILWIRATLPRLRVDQSMGFCWKFLLPVALVNLLFTAARMTFFPDLSNWIVIPASFVFTAIVIYLFAGLFKPGRKVAEND